MGYKVSLWTWRRGHVLVGNETSLVFHAAMQFHAYLEAAEKYTNDYYKVSIYKACYEPIIDPING